MSALDLRFSFAAARAAVAMVAWLPGWRLPHSTGPLPCAWLQIGWERTNALNQRVLCPAGVRKRRVPSKP